MMVAKIPPLPFLLAYTAMGNEPFFGFLQNLWVAEALCTYLCTYLCYTTEEQNRSYINSCC